MINRNNYLNYRQFKETMGIVQYLRSRKQRFNKDLANEYIRFFTQMLTDIKKRFDKEKKVFGGYSDIMKKEIMLIKNVALCNLIEKDLLSHDVSFKRGVLKGKALLNSTEKLV